jgi:hypothetical protein
MYPDKPHILADANAIVCLLHNVQRLKGGNLYGV